MLFCKERHSENVLRIPLRIRNILGICKTQKGGLLGCNFGIYKSDLLKVNGFDERFLAPATGEDTDLEARLARIGIPYIGTYSFAVYIIKSTKEWRENPIPTFQSSKKTTDCK
ncbi:MAG: galactosyltransferase-related protein [Paludibacteraceae bacterium]|nr:galactosyltransferase-related protein [Paludibacteraceae bacterium]